MQSLGNLRDGMLFNFEMKTGEVPINVGDTSCGMSFDSPMSGDEMTIFFNATPHFNNSEIELYDMPKLSATEVNYAGFRLNISTTVDCMVQYIAIRSRRTAMEPIDQAAKRMNPDS